jgi:hypothetical protein
MEVVVCTVGILLIGLTMIFKKEGDNIINMMTD